MENLNISSIMNKKQKLELKPNHPIKLIKTNRAECHYMTDDDNFNLFDYLEDDFFSTEKAIKLRKEENEINEKERDKLFFNFMPAVKCLKRMTDVIEEEKMKNEINPNSTSKSIKLNIQKKINNGVLYEFFYSEKFNIDLLIIYLNKENSISIIDTLIELMYQKYINQSLFYLPQLCMFFNYKEYYSSIKSYLLDRCVDQIKFSLQITWLLNSFTEDDTPLIKSDVYEWLLQKIEETLVNGERNTVKLFNQYKQLQKEESKKNNIYNKIYNDFDFGYKKEKSIEMLPFLEKQSRLVYFNICNEFYSSLKNMCEDLKNYPKENDQRKNKLMEYIKTFNDNFIQQRTDNEEYLLNYPSFFGIILPFNDSSSTEDIDSYLIVRIIQDQCFCFSTKARVPTKICAECIQVKELKNSEYLNHNNNNNKKEKKPNNKNLFMKTFTILDNDKNKIVGTALRRKQSQKIRQFSLLGHHNLNNNNLEINRLSNKSQKSDDNKEEEEKGEKIRNFLYNINKTIEEENENKIIENDENNDENNIIKKEENEKNNIKNESDKNIVDDFEILPDMTEDLKNVFGKPMDIIKKDIQHSSPFKKFKTYKLVNFIAKANDDLRQELLAMQLIKFFDKIFKEEKLPLYIRTYEILITSSSSGLLEFLENTSSIDGIKKKMATSSKNLCIFYKKYFKDNYEEAQINFTRSLAAYSLICYYLQIKDRHNGNILIDMNGHIIHIDFGFILGIAPGGINFERAPFKLTKEYVEIMGGKDSLYYQMYKDLMVKGMIACKKYVDNFINIAEIMSKGSKMPCFDNKNTADIFNKFRERFFQDKNDEDFIKIVDDLINWSYDNFRTNQYDNYQKLTNGIIP